MSKTIRTLLLFVVLLCLIHNVDSCLRRTKIVYKDVCRTSEPLTQLNSTSETGGPSSDGVTKPSTKGGVVPDAITTKATVPSTTPTTSTTTTTTPSTTSTTSTTTPTTTTTSTTPKKPTTKDSGDIEVGLCNKIIGKVPITDAADCKAPWIFVGNGCFQFVTEKDQNSWIQAEKLALTKKCEEAGGMFSAPRSESVMQNVVAALNGVPNARMMWLGIQNAKHDTFERYMDGSRLVYTRWVDYHPYTRFKGDQCVVLNQEKKAWEAVPCEGKQDALLCEKKQDGEVCKPLDKECVFTFENENKKCEEGWAPYRGAAKCYKFIGTAQNYHEHEDAAKAMQATLASIHSNGQMEFLRGLYDKFDRSMSPKTPPFIGLDRRSNNFDFITYQDGSIIDYAFFEKKAIAMEPQLRLNHKCVGFKKVSVSNTLTRFSAENCWEKHPAIYSKDAKGQWQDSECKGHVVVRNFKSGKRPSIND